MSLSRVQSVLATAALVASLASCNDAPGSLGGVAGTWRATTYLAGPEGAPQQDILGLSVTWTIVMMDNGYAYSTMNATNPMNGITTTTAAKKGGVRRDGDLVLFHDFDGYRFLTERTWTVNAEGQLESLDQVVDGVKASIRFTRE